VEIIVCDNASTDGTTEEIAKAADQDQRIRWIQEPRTGKTHAWNRLFREAQFDLVVFMDADVIPAPGVIQRLCRALTDNPQLILVGAHSIPYRKSLRLWNRFVAAVTQPNRHQTWIVGRMYALKRPEFTQRMRQLGVEQMPEILAAEDTWVSLVAGPGNWQVDLDAIVYHMPYTLGEFVRIERRHLVSLDQLRRECPQLVDQAGLARKPWELGRQKLGEVTRTKGLTARICSLARLLIVVIVRRHLRRELRREQRRGNAAPFAWEVSEASKNLPEQMA
jgi:glycosyltransferase involved in cell wall biosynthesis